MEMVKRSLQSKLEPVDYENFKTNKKWRKELCYRLAKKVPETAIGDASKVRTSQSEVYSEPQVVQVMDGPYKGRPAVVVVGSRRSRPNQLAIHSGPRPEDLIIVETGAPPPRDRANVGVQLTPQATDELASLATPKAGLRKRKREQQEEEG